MVSASKVEFGVLDVVLCDGINDVRFVVTFDELSAQDDVRTPLLYMACSHDNTTV